VLVATIVCAVACGLLVFAEWRRDTKLRILTKPIASLAFIAVGVLGMGDSDYARWVVAGLVLGAVGDVALLGSSNRAFLLGLGAFLLGHLSYVVAAAQVRSPADWITDAHAFAFIPIAIALTALQWLWPRLGSMRIPVIGYMLAIVAMMIGAIAVGRASTLPTRVCFVVGAALFFASDLAVARDKFVEKSFTNRAWGLPAYYAGQLFIAWSVT
jgi:uncharacterized membrane protein YhhN